MKNRYDPYEDKVYTGFDNVVRIVFNYTIQYVVLALFLIFASHAVKASEREHGDTQSAAQAFGNDVNPIPYVVGGIVVTGCVIVPVSKAYVWPAIKSVFTWRRPSWGKWDNCFRDWQDARDSTDPLRPAPATNVGESL